jgi:hypothetical protein
MNKKICLINSTLILACIAAFAEDASKDSVNNEKAVQKGSSLAGSVFCGYELHETGAYWSMAITTSSTNKEIFDVVWTKPLSKSSPPYDNKYRNSESLVLKSVENKKVKFARPTYRQNYEAEIDSDGNLVNGTISEIESGKTTKSVWKLFKVK